LTPQQWTKLFAGAYPKAVDVPVQEYQIDRLMADETAKAAGYRMAGIREGRAVFTTKLKLPSAAEPRKPSDEAGGP